MSRLYECDHCHEVQKEELTHMTVHIGNCGFGGGEYCKKCAMELKRLVHDWAGKALCVDITYY